MPNLHQDDNNLNIAEVMNESSDSSSNNLNSIYHTYLGDFQIQKRRFSNKSELNDLVRDLALSRE